MKFEEVLSRRDHGLPHTEKDPVSVERAPGCLARENKAVAGPAGCGFFDSRARRAERTAGSSGTSRASPDFVDLRPSQMLYECRMKRRSSPISSRRRARTSPRRAPVVIAMRQATRARSSAQVVEKEGLHLGRFKDPAALSLPREAPEAARRVTGYDLVSRSPA